MRYGLRHFKQENDIVLEPVVITPECQDDAVQLSTNTAELEMLCDAFDSYSKAYSDVASIQQEYSEAKVENDFHADVLAGKMENELQSVLSTISGNLYSSRFASSTVFKSRKQESDFKRKGITGFQYKLEGLGDILGSIWEGIKKFFKAIWDFISSIFKGIASLFSSSSSSSSGGGGGGSSSGSSGSSKAEKPQSVEQAKQQVEEHYEESLEIVEKRTEELAEEITKLEGKIEKAQENNDTSKVESIIKEIVEASERNGRALKNGWRRIEATRESLGAFKKDSESETILSKTIEKIIIKPKSKDLKKLNSYLKDLENFSKKSAERMLKDKVNRELKLIEMNIKNEARKNFKLFYSLYTELEKIAETSGIMFSIYVLRNTNEIIETNVKNMEKIKDACESINEIFKAGKEYDFSNGPIKLKNYIDKNDGPLFIINEVKKVPKKDEAIIVASEFVQEFPDGNGDHPGELKAYKDLKFTIGGQIKNNGKYGWSPYVFSNYTGVRDMPKNLNLDDGARVYNLLDETPERIKNEVLSACKLIEKEFNEASGSYQDLFESMEEANRESEAIDISIKTNIATAVIRNNIMVVGRAYASVANCMATLANKIVRSVDVLNKVEKLCMNMTDEDVIDELPFKPSELKLDNFNANKKLINRHFGEFAKTKAADIRFDQLVNS